MPSASNAREINLAIGKVIQAVGDGTITPSEGQTMSALLEVHRRGIETANLEERVSRLEEVNERDTRWVARANFALRLDKIEEKVLPGGDVTFTWDEFRLAIELSRLSEQELRQRSASDPALVARLARFTKLRHKQAQQPGRCRKDCL
jgi:hypothetical protein